MTYHIVVVGDLERIEGIDDVAAMPDFKAPGNVTKPESIAACYRQGKGLVGG